jgi:hypothetical protein
MQPPGLYFALGNWQRFQAIASMLQNALQTPAKLDFKLYAS